MPSETVGNSQNVCLFCLGIRGPSPWLTHSSRNSSPCTRPPIVLMYYPTNLPIVVDVFCRQPIRCPSPVGEFLMGSRRSSYNHCLELGIYINMIVRWFIHASVVSYVQNNNAWGSIKTIEHTALKRLRKELISATTLGIRSSRWCRTLQFRTIVKHINS